jgi:hypothetical protein
MMSQTSQQWLTKHGVVGQALTPYAHHKNPAEAQVKKVVGLALVYLAKVGYALNMLPWMCDAACLAWSLMDTQAHYDTQDKDVVPLTRLTGRRYSLDILVKPGSRGCAYKDDATRASKAPKAGIVYAVVRDVNSGDWVVSNPLTQHCYQRECG